MTRDSAQHITFCSTCKDAAAAQLWTGKELLIAFIKPFGAVERDTVLQWIKEVLTMADVDTTKYTAHSTWVARTFTAQDTT